MIPKCVTLNDPKFYFIRISDDDDDDRLNHWDRGGGGVNCSSTPECRQFVGITFYQKIIVQKSTIKTCFKEI